MRVTLRSSKLALNLKEHSISLDSEGSFSFISHAHSDHANVRKKSKVVASEATVDLMHARKYCNGLEAKKEFQIEGLKTELLNAGHVLGSTQLFAEHDGSSFLYTGDFKTEDSLLFNGAEAKECDLLLTESTYGSPEYSFPKREEVYDEMKDFVLSETKKGNSVVLGGYSLGKAQELVKFLNEYCSIAPIVNEEISSINSVYEKHGIKLEYIPTSSPEAQQSFRHSFVSVIPFHILTPFLLHDLQQVYGRKFSGAVASGWCSKLGKNGMQGFSLSDHCDFPSLLEFVGQCNPKQVIVNHGFSREFAKELRKRGINATSIEETTLEQELLVN